jgi:hypothetical protein
LFWIAGSPTGSGKYSDCRVIDRDNWSCTVGESERASIAHELSHGRPTPERGGPIAAFRAVAKWKWWALRLGIPGFNEADFGNGFDEPHARDPAQATT